MTTTHTHTGLPRYRSKFYSRAAVLLAARTAQSSSESCPTFRVAARCSELHLVGTKA